jgi:hypothetical protein
LKFLKFIDIEGAVFELSEIKALGQEYGPPHDKINEIIVIAELGLILNLNENFKKLKKHSCIVDTVSTIIQFLKSHKITLPMR